MQQMNLAISSLASGSSGNSFLIRNEDTALLVDAGISAKQTASDLADLGLSLADVDAVLVTHEHTDHIKGLKAVCGASGAAVYATRGTLKGIPFAGDLADARVFCPGDKFRIGSIDVGTFPTSHDAAEPSGFSFSANSRKIVIVTDTGTVTWQAFDSMRGSDVLVLESNHDVSVLKMGRYPWFLKQRILSDYGHLSNEAAANAVLELLRTEQQEGAEKSRLVLLAHLSKENNFPQMALATMSNILAAEGFAPSDRLRIEVLSRTERSPLYIL